jgi:hypothetical protein
MPATTVAGAAIIEECEARILFSADILASALDPGGPLHLREEVMMPGMPASDSSLSESHATQDSQEWRRHEIVFIDSSVADYQAMAEAILSDQRHAALREVVILDAGRDGIAQIGAALEGRSNLTALHIISHGEAGVLTLGGTRLSAQGLLEQAEAISHWGDALAPGADILLYGCEVAADASGRTLVNGLAQLTGADVAASKDLTGSALLGGNWILEYRTGLIETEAALNYGFQADWSNVLATYVVTNTNDAGVGSLRQALLDANGNAGADNITFNIGAGGLQTIRPLSALPDITGTVVIDGTTQPGFASAPIIELSGVSTDPLEQYSGLRFVSGSSGGTVKGLIIGGFTNYGVEIGSVSSITVQGNYIGTDPTGELGRGNLRGGILAWGASNTVIGGVAEAERNVISGNDWRGINILGGGAGTIISGNYIGTNASGTAAIQGGLGSWGIYIRNAGGVLIGGTAPGAGNVIAGNGLSGIQIWISSGWSVPGSTIAGNYIGVGADGVTAIGNGGAGISLMGPANTMIGGTAAGAGNIIAHSYRAGVALGWGQGNAILGNSIYGNRQLGIDLDHEGGYAAERVNYNDGALTDESNRGMDFPVITTSGLSESILTLAGYVGSAPGQAIFGNARVEFFKSSGDESGHGEGERYLGYLTADASGNFSGTLSVSGLADGDTLTATATSTTSDTSEFSANRAISVNSNAPVITSDGGGESAAISILENTTAVTTVRATDADIAPVLRYGIAGGADAGRFAIDSYTGVLRFIAPPDRENPADSNGDNVYEVTVSASDSSHGDTQAISVAVLNVIEGPVGRDHGIGLPEDGSYTFSAGDFGFFDQDGNAFQSVEITSLAGGGELQYKGVAINGGDRVLKADLDAGRLVFLPARNENGAAYASYAFRVINDAGLMDESARTMTIDVSAVNDAPVHSMPAAAHIRQDGVLVLASLDDRMQVADVDVAPGMLEVTLSVTNGILISGPTSGSSIVFAGTSADVNTFLQALTFRPANGYAGIATLTMVSTDMGNAGIGGPQTTRSTMKIVMDPPATFDGGATPGPQPPQSVMEPPATFGDKATDTPDPALTDAPSATGGSGANGPAAGADSGKAGKMAASVYSRSLAAHSVTAGSVLSRVLGDFQFIQQNPAHQSGDHDVASHDTAPARHMTVHHIDLPSLVNGWAGGQGLRIVDDLPDHPAPGANVYVSQAVQGSEDTEKDTGLAGAKAMEGAGILVSVATLWLLANKGSLVASLFASMPAWQRLDPLHILPEHAPHDSDDAGYGLEDHIFSVDGMPDALSPDEE